MNNEYCMVDLDRGTNCLTHGMHVSNCSNIRKRRIEELERALQTHPQLVRPEDAGGAKGLLMWEELRQWRVGARRALGEGA